MGLGFVILWRVRVVFCFDFRFFVALIVCFKFLFICILVGAFFLDFSMVVRLYSVFSLGGVLLGSFCFVV